MKNAVPELSDHRHILNQLESIVEPRFIEQWTSDVEAWEADAKAPNPFEPRTKGTVHKSLLWQKDTYLLADPTQNGIRLQLARRDAEEIGTEGLGTTTGGDISGRMMVMMGIELEALQ